MGEHISRLMDGDLEGVEADAAFRELKQDEALATWDCYHVIGDTLRRVGTPPPAFGRRFVARLEAEPTVLAPRPRHAPQLPFVWAAAATVAAVTVVGWVALNALDSQSTAVAKAREAAISVATRTKTPRVAQDYLLAHQEYSPTTQIQGVGPALRQVAVGGVEGRP